MIVQFSGYFLQRHGIAQRMRAENIIRVTFFNNTVFGIAQRMREENIVADNNFMLVWVT